MTWSFLRSFFHTMHFWQAIDRAFWKIVRLSFGDETNPPIVNSDCIQQFILWRVWFVSDIVTKKQEGTRYCRLVLVYIYIVASLTGSYTYTEFPLLGKNANTRLAYIMYIIIYRDKIYELEIMCICIVKRYYDQILCQTMKKSKPYLLIFVELIKRILKRYSPWRHEYNILFTYILIYQF